MSYQTRSNDGETLRFASFLEAYDAWKNNRDIYKISFGDGINNRWLVKIPTQNRWHEQCEELLESLNSTYSRTSNKIFWIEKSVMAPNYDKLILKEPCKDRRKLLNDLSSIKSCLTDDEFRNKYENNRDKL